MHDFQKALTLAKRVESFGLKINFTAGGWQITKGGKKVIVGGDLNRLQYFVEGMKYGSTQQTDEVREGGRGKPLFVELEGEEPDPALLYAQVDAAKADAEKWRKRYERVRSRLRRAQSKTESKKVWVAICPNDYRYAEVRVGATRDAASEAMMYASLGNEDIERVYFEEHDVEPETKRNKEAKKAPKKEKK